MSNIWSLFFRSRELSDEIKQNDAVYYPYRGIFTPF